MMKTMSMTCADLSAIKDKEKNRKHMQKQGGNVGALVASRYAPDFGLVSTGPWFEARPGLHGQVGNMAVPGSGSWSRYTLPQLWTVMATAVMGAHHAIGLIRRAQTHSSMDVTPTRSLVSGAPAQDNQGPWLAIGCSGRRTYTNGAVGRNRSPKGSFDRENKEFTRARISVGVFVDTSNHLPSGRSTRCTLRTAALNAVCRASVFFCDQIASMVALSRTQSNDAFA